jgi:predicted nuclease of restriction endonuclease-like (RecB) superfamily
VNTGRNKDLPKNVGSARSTDALGYGELLEELKARIRSARVRASLALNRELVHLYWHIGREILSRQEAERWGAKVVDRLATDLRREFPDMTGLSRTNLLYMRAFAEAYPDESIVQQAVGRIPWGHIITLLSKLDDPRERLWYVEQTVEHGWSRALPRSCSRTPIISTSSLSAWTCANGSWRVPWCGTCSSS